jgi:hypothetical protein
MVLNRNDDHLIVVSTDPKAKRLPQFEIEGEGNQIQDHHCFGPNKSHVVLMRDSGFIQIIKIDLKQRTYKIMSEFWLELMHDRREEAVTMAVCPEGKYFVVHTWVRKEFASRMIVLEYEKPRGNNQGQLHLKDSYDIFNKRLNYFRAMTCFGYINENLVIPALSYSFDSELYTFVYDVQMQKIEEIPELRKVTELDNPRNFHKLEDSLVAYDDKLNRMEMFYPKQSGGCALI